MRPVRLELEGFTAFREPTVVDFAGVDLFALTGPTGAGKTTVIDAMIFALYGTVPRFGDDRLVAPVISQGRTECAGPPRLRRRRRAVHRDARRAPHDGRATTREARLERAGEVVAGNATELDAAVAALLGLDAATSSRPAWSCRRAQFARFLHDKPAERQTLLVRLLELGLFDAVREAAGQRAGRLEGERAGIGAHLAALAVATPEAIAAERERCCRLERAEAEVESRVPELEAADRRPRRPAADPVRAAGPGQPAGGRARPGGRRRAGGSGRRGSRAPGRDRGRGASRGGRGGDRAGAT